MSLHSLLEQDITVLTASRRLAHAVRQSYARELQARGVCVWQTPRVLPWSAWLRQQHLEARATGVANTNSRVLTPAQTRALWDDIVANSRAAADLLNPSSAARLAARSWRLLQDYAIPLERLQGFDSAEAQALQEWCLEFARRCELLGVIDEARLTQWALDVRLTPEEPVAFAGFDALTPRVEQLAQRWREAGKLVEIENEPRDARVVAVQAADRDAELVLAAQWARERVAEGAASVGIIVPDLQSRHDAVRRVFADVLDPGTRRTGTQGGAQAVVIAAPAPLSSYPLVDAALLMLKLVIGNVPSTLAGRVLRSPFLRGGEHEQAARALADVRIRKEQRDVWDAFKFERWASLTGCEQLSLATRDLTTLVRTLPASALASEWAERFQSLWLAMGWPGERALNSTEYQTLQKFHEALAAFGALDTVSGRMNLRRAVARLADLLGETPFEPETGDAAITVIDAATSAGMQFDALWVSGLDAERFPAAINPDPLIPRELQRLANIPEATAAGVLRQATTQLSRWQRSARQVVLSWAARDGDIEFTRSPLLAHLPIEAPTETPAIALRDWLFRERPTLESLQDVRAPALPQQAARGGSRTLELQSRCPFRAQAELRLRAEPLPRVSVGIEPVDRGALLHRVLADVWGELRTQQRLIALDDTALEQLVRTATQTHAMQSLAVDTPSRERLVQLEIESVVRNVTRLLQQEKLRPGFRVHLAEESERFEIGGLSITLRPDRIDLLEGGGELLIDYKLGASHKPRDWFDAVGRPRRPQLPLYGLAHADRLRGLAYVVLAPGVVEYRGWSDGTPMGEGIVAWPSGTRIDLGDPADWDSLLHHWNFTLTRLAEHYVAGDAAVDPLPQECATCHLSSLCRVNEVVVEADDAEGRLNDE